MPFGKFKGALLSELAKEHPWYLPWVLKNCPWIEPWLRTHIEAAIAEF
jgi:hypothetical protein